MYFRQALLMLSIATPLAKASGAVCSFQSALYEDGTELNNESVLNSSVSFKYYSDAIGVSISLPGYSQQINYSTVKYEAEDSSYVLFGLFKGRENVIKIYPEKGILVFRYPDRAPLYFSYSNCQFDVEKINALLDQKLKSQMSYVTCSTPGATMYGGMSASDILKTFSELRIIRTPKFSQLYATGPGLMMGFQPYDGVLESSNNKTYENSEGSGKFILDFSSPKVSATFYEDARYKNRYVKLEYSCINNKDFLISLTKFPVLNSNTAKKKELSKNQTQNSYVMDCTQNSILRFSANGQENLTTGSNKYKISGNSDSISVTELKQNGISTLIGNYNYSKITTIDGTDCLEFGGSGNIIVQKCGSELATLAVTSQDKSSMRLFILKCSNQ